MTALLTGFVLGVIGSGHCVGMCGPLVLTLGRVLARPSRRAQVQHPLTYHAGRVLTYMILALPVGLAGQALAVRGFGRALAIAAAVVLLLAAAGSLRPRLLGRIGSLWATAIARACVTANRWSQAHPIAGPALTGAANGLLPCGLVYAAATVAAARGSGTEAVVLMAGFGLGTVPALVALTMSAASLPLSMRLRLRQLTPVVLALTAALLLVRALSTPAHAPHHHAPSAVVVH